MHARMDTLESGETEKAGKRESVRACYRIFQVGVEGEGFCCSLYKQPLMNKIVVI